jgi:hypothetical protein
MAKWTGQILKAVTSTSIGVGALAAASSSARRLKLTEFLCGSDAATLGTSNFRWEFQRSTTAATGTAIAYSGLDPSEGSGGSVLQGNLSANGTLTTNALMMTIAISQQATFRWVANPGSEIIIPATANAGLHFMTPVCGNTPSAAAHVIWDEQ